MEITVQTKELRGIQNPVGLIKTDTGKIYGKSKI